MVFHEKRYEMIFHFKTPDFMTTPVSPLRFYFELGFRDSDDISQKAYMAYHRLDTYYRNLLPATTGCRTNRTVTNIASTSFEMPPMSIVFDARLRSLNNLVGVQNSMIFEFTTTTPLYVGNGFQFMGMTDVLKVAEFRCTPVVLNYPNAVYLGLTDYECFILKTTQELPIVKLKLLKSFVPAGKFYFVVNFRNPTLVQDTQYSGVWFNIATYDFETPVKGGGGFVSSIVDKGITVPVSPHPSLFAVPEMPVFFYVSEKELETNYLIHLGKDDRPEKKSKLFFVFKLSKDIPRVEDMTFTLKAPEGFHFDEVCSVDLRPVFWQGWRTTEDQNAYKASEVAQLGVGVPS